LSTLGAHEHTDWSTGGGAGPSLPTPLPPPEVLSPPPLHTPARAVSANQGSQSKSFYGMSRPSTVSNKKANKPAPHLFVDVLAHHLPLACMHKLAQLHHRGRGSLRLPGTPSKPSTTTTKATTTTTTTTSVTTTTPSEARHFFGEGVGGVSRSRNPHRLLPSFPHPYALPSRPPSSPLGWCCTWLH